MPRRKDTEGGRHKMPTVTAKPIRPTEVTISDPIARAKFINYATSTEKTHNDIMDRVRRELKAHQRSPKRK